MDHVSSSAKPPSQYDTFLSASIAEQENGTPVSVLSGLIRGNYDPWQEAARLAELPPDRACREFAELLNGLRGRNSDFVECENLAKNLVQLLPPPESQRLPASQGESAREGLPLLAYWLFWIGFVVLLTLGQPQHQKRSVNQISAEAALQNQRLALQRMSPSTNGSVKKLRAPPASINRGPTE